MKVAIDFTTATPIRRRPGANVTIVNQSAVDVYFDSNPNRLNASLAGTAPDGTKIAANGGQITWANWPSDGGGVIWFRAVSATTLEVAP